MHSLVMMDCEKERDPTRERPCKEGKEETQDSLYRLLKDLQQEWDSIKQSRSRRTLRRASTDSETMVKTLQLLENSPRNLMSTLQYGRSPSEGRGGVGGAWKVMRNNDLAVEEILKERKEAIENGKLKGRRLFEAIDHQGNVNDMDYLDIQESEVRSACSYDSDDENGRVKERKEWFSPLYCHYYSHSSSSSASSSFVCGDCIEKQLEVNEAENELVAAAAASVQKEMKIRGANCDEDVYGTSWMMVMAWLVIASIVCAIGIMSKRSSTGDDHSVGNKVIPFPT